MNEVQQIKIEKAVRIMNRAVLQRMYDSKDFNYLMAFTDTLQKILDVYAAVFEIELPDDIASNGPQEIMDIIIELNKAKKEANHA